MRTSVLLALCLVRISSFAVGAEPRVERDVAYAEHGSATTLDIYAPGDGKDHPVLIWIHGGGWRHGSKNPVLRKPQMLNEHGFILVSINYRLQPGVTYRDQAGDVARAIRWVHEHAHEYGGAADHIFLMGHSAGAHLAALVATDNRYLAAEKLKLSLIRGVILLDGAAYDIRQQLKLAPLPRMRELYTSAFGENPTSHKDASPITHVAQGKDIPPFLILYVATRLDGRIQSVALAERLKESGVPAEAVPAMDKTHMTINRDLGQPDDPPTEEIFRFLDERRKSPKD